MEAQRDDVALPNSAKLSKWQSGDRTKIGPVIPGPPPGEDE